jgi:O-antigen/teichoic acid export membrane protein
MESNPSRILPAVQPELSPMRALSSVRQRLAFDSTLALGIKMVFLPLGCLTSLAVARFWGAQGLGVFTLAAYLVTTLSVVCRLGLDTGMLRFGASLKAAGQDGVIVHLYWRGLSLVLCLSCGAAVGLFLTRGWLARVFHAQALPEVLPLMSLALPVMAAAAFCSETLRSLGGARWVVTQQDLLTPAGLLLLVGLFVWQGPGFSSSPAALGLAYLLSGTLGLVFLGAILGSRLKGHRVCGEPAGLGDLLRYSWPLYVSVLLMLVFSAVDSLVLGYFAGPEKVAYYEAAGRTALLVSLPLMAVNAVVPPFFAQMHQKGRQPELETLAQVGARWTYLVSLPLAIFMAALAPDILELFGAGFEEGRWALLVLILAQLINVACGSVGFMLAMTGHQVTLTAILALGGALGLPLMSVGAAIFGMNGLALIKGFWLVGVNILMSLGVWRCLGIKVFASRVGWANASGVAGFALFCLVRPHIGSWAAAGVGALAYLALISRTLYQEFAEVLCQTRWEASR